MGTVVDQGKFDAAFTNSTNKTQVMSSKVTSALPPWWILKGVKPAGSERDMGSWKAITFSKAQQAKYGVDEDGTVVDQGKFHAAFTNSTTLAPEVGKEGAAVDQSRSDAAFGKRVIEAPRIDTRTYNCLTRELWSQDKRDWCCENKKLGCPMAQVCCEAMTASCLACQQGKTILKFCKDPKNARVSGCTPAPKKALRANSEYGEKSTPP